MNISLAGKEYGYWNPYIISEIGVNHEGDLELAKKLIKLSAEGGAHGVKFQTYKAEKIASQNNSKYYWDLNSEPSQSQYELFKKYDAFNREEYLELAKYSKSLGVDFLSTPFDLDAVDMLEDLVPFYKIASADITNIPLLRKVASKKKPVILSTGAATLSEIQEAVHVLKTSGAATLCLLHCVLNYPTPEEKAFIGVMKTLAKTYPDIPIGYSDHVTPTKKGEMPALLLASTLGAVVLEKHFTHDKTLPGNDHYHAMNREDLLLFNEQLAQFRTLYGNEEKQLGNEQRAREKARRRICVAKDLVAGSLITEDNIIALRSDIGVEVQHWDGVIGKKLAGNIKQNEPITWRDLQD